MPCVNPNNNPADPKAHYHLVRSVGGGCGTLGEDDHSTLAD